MQDKILENSALEREKQPLHGNALLPGDRSETNGPYLFSLVYHPFNKMIKNIIYKSLSIFQDDPNTRNIFELLHFIAFRRDKNFNDTLVRSNRKTNDPCNDHFCQTCTHISNAITFTYGNRNLAIWSAFACSSSSVVYCIACSKCNILHTGKTSRLINNRFGEHLRNVRNKLHFTGQCVNNLDSKISRHFNLPYHST